MSLARYSRSTRYCAESRKFCIWVQHSDITPKDIRPSDKLTRGFHNRYIGGIKYERLLSIKKTRLLYCFFLNHIQGQKQVAPDAISKISTGDANNLPWIKISRRQVPSVVLNRVSAYLRSPWYDNPTHQLIWKESLPLVRPPMTATSALLRGTRSGNTPCAMTTYKHSEKRSEEGFQGITSRYSKSSNSRMDSALFCVSNSKYVQWTGFAETTNLLYRPVETNLRKSKGSLFDFSFFFINRTRPKVSHLLSLFRHCGTVSIFFVWN